MNIGLQSSIYNNLSIVQEISFTIAQNIGYFDIFFDNWSPLDLTLEELDFITKCGREGLKFSVHLPIDDYSKINKKKIKPYTDFIKTINPYSVTIHFNHLSIEVLDYLLFELKGISTLSIENTVPDIHKIYNMSFLDFLKFLGNKGGLAVTLDTGHSFVNKFKPHEYLHAITEMGIKVSTVHLHDNLGDKDNHLPLGKGSIDFITLFNKFNKLETNPLFIIEHWDENLTSLDYIKGLL